MNCMNGRNDCRGNWQENASGCQRNTDCAGNNCGCRTNSGMQGRMTERNNCGCRNGERMQGRMMERKECGCEHEEKGKRDCGCDTDPIMGMPLAMGYVPMQAWGCVYSVDEAISHGTIFPELDLPFYGCIPKGCAMGERR